MDKVVRFGILGTVGVWRDGLAVPVGGARQRRMLAALLLDPGRVIPAARLIDVLWDDPPDSAVKQLHNCVAEVRRRLAAGGLDPALLSTETTGYLIRADPDSIDYSRFVRMTGEGRGKARNGELAGAIERFDAALALWRGPALVDVTGRVLTSIAATFNEQRLAAVEERTALLLESGRQEEAAVEAARWFTEHPARESLAALLMRSLYGAGQQVDALEVYRVLRSRLTEDYGIEPSRRLNDLHAAILRREDLPTATPGNGERRADDAGDVEPAPSSWFSPAELPAPPQSFVGRTDPLRALDALLAPVVEGGGSRLALIAGGAGIGKSALALHWAHKVAGSFPHGQVYADLGGYSPSGPTASIEILTGVLRSFGVPPERIPQTVPAAASLYRTTLAGLRVLLLLDDAASAEQVRPLIPGGTGCVAIVTSRRTLGGLVAREGAVPVHLEPLTEPEAVRLLEQVVGPTRRTNEPRALGDLVHLCGGLPLALRIAGARIVVEPGLTISDLVAAMRGPEPLTALRVDDDTGTSIPAVFALWYRSLAPGDRRALRLLAAAPMPDLGIEALAALVGHPVHDIVPVVDRLLAAHLADRLPSGRLTMHELIRSFAAARAEEEEGAAECGAAVRRMITWYLRRADAATAKLYPHMHRLPDGEHTEESHGFPDCRAALAWLDVERRNLAVIAAHSADLGVPSAAWAVANSLRGYLWHGRHDGEWLTVASAGLANAAAAGDKSGIAAAQFALGARAASRGLHPEAVERYLEALQHATSMGWHGGASNIEVCLAYAYAEMGDLDTAAEHQRRAREWLADLDSPAAEATVLALRGFLRGVAGRPREAIGDLTRAIHLDREAGSLINEACHRHNLAAAHHELGDPETAHRHLLKAWELHRDLLDRTGEMRVLNTLAEVAQDRGNDDQALSYAREALTIATRSGDRLMAAQVRNTLGTLHLRLGHAAAAITEHRCALQLARTDQACRPAVDARLGLARAYHDVGDHDEARAQARRALRQAGNARMDTLRNQALRLLRDMDGQKARAGW